MLLVNSCYEIHRWVEFTSFYLECFAIQFYPLYYFKPTTFNCSYATLEESCDSMWDNLSQYIQKNLRWQNTQLEHNKVRGNT